MDNIITDLHNWYQEPKCLPPIEPDSSTGKPSDHLMVIWEPLNVINNIPTRHIRKIKLRPITDSGIKLFSLWIKDQEWTEINETHDVDHKVELLTSSVMEKVRQFFPEKLTKVTSDDAPWCSPKVRKLKLLKGREFNKHRSSIKWANLDKLYKSFLQEAKQKYYKNIIKDLKTSNPSQWYSKLKRICTYDQEKYEPSKLQ